MRIEGSQGMPEREFNGPVVGLQERYRKGLAALGGDFTEVDGKEQRRRLRADEEFCDMLTATAARACTARPSTAGTERGGVGVPRPATGDVQPRGYSDAEVSGR